MLTTAFLAGFKKRAIAAVAGWDLTAKGPEILISENGALATMLSDGTGDRGNFPNNGNGEVGRASGGRNSGKAYFEIEFAVGGPEATSFGGAVGLVDETYNRWKPALYPDAQYTYLGGPGGQSWSCYVGGWIYYNDIGTDTGMSDFLTTVGTTARVAVDFAEGKIWFGTDAGWFGDPAAGTGSVTSFTPGTLLYPAYQHYAVGDALRGKFSNGAFAYAPPANFVAWQN